MKLRKKKKQYLVFVYTIFLSFIFLLYLNTNLSSQAYYTHQSGTQIAQPASGQDPTIPGAIGCQGSSACPPSWSTCQGTNADYGYALYTCPGNNASCGIAPSGLAIAPGASQDVTVSMNNTGDTWDGSYGADSEYKLKYYLVEKSTGNAVAGSESYESIPLTTTVSGGNSQSFTFPVTAPGDTNGYTSSDGYTLKWQMYREQSNWPSTDSGAEPYTMTTFGTECSTDIKLPAPTNVNSFCNSATEARITWDTAPGDDKYIIRVNNRNSDSASKDWITRNDFWVGLNKSYVCDTFGNCSFTTGVSDYLPDRDVGFCNSSSCNNLTDGPANIVTGERYTWTISPLTSTNYEGTGAGGEFTCTLPTPTAIPPTPTTAPVTGNPILGTLRIQANTTDTPAGVAGGSYGTSGLRSNDTNVPAGTGQDYYNSLTITQGLAGVSNGDNVALVATAFTNKRYPPENNTLYELTKSANRAGAGFVLLYANKDKTATYSDIIGRSTTKSFTANRFYVYYNGSWSPAHQPIRTDPYNTSALYVKMEAIPSFPAGPTFYTTLYQPFRSGVRGTYGYVMDNSSSPNNEVTTSLNPVP